MLSAAWPPTSVVRLLLVLTLGLAWGSEVSIEDQCLTDEQVCSPSTASAVHASSLLQSDARRNEAISVRPKRLDDNEMADVGHQRIHSLESRVQELESHMIGKEAEEMELATDSALKRSGSSKKGGNVVHPVFSTDCSTTEGKQCVFGVDARDEGIHCVPELDYGQFGWCYTKTDMTAWGPCSARCPLSGRFGVLQRKMKDVSGQIKELQDEVDDMPDCIKSKGEKKAPKSGAKTPPDDAPSESKKKKTGAKSGAKAAPDDNSSDDDKVTKSGPKSGRKTPPDSLVGRRAVAMSGIKASARRLAKRSPRRQEQEEHDEPLLSNWNRRMALRAKAHKHI